MKRHHRISKDISHKFIQHHSTTRTVTQPADPIASVFACFSLFCGFVSSLIMPAVGWRICCRVVWSNFEGITKGTACILAQTYLTACRHQFQCIMILTCDKPQFKWNWHTARANLHGSAHLGGIFLSLKANGQEVQGSNKSCKHSEFNNHLSCH